MEDTLIVDLYLSKNEQAIEESAKKYGSRLKNLAYGIVEDAQTAEECENDTYLDAWNAIPPHEPRDYLYAFLARITRNLSLNCCRDRSRLKRSGHILELSREMEECIPSPENVTRALEESVLRDTINGFLRTLPEISRNVFLRRYWYLDSIASISLRFGFSQSKVKSMLMRSRKKLRQYLEKEGYSL